MDRVEKVPSPLFCYPIGERRKTNGNWETQGDQKRDAIWGTVTLGSDNRTITTRDTTPKGVAAPATDEVYKGTGEITTPTEPEAKKEIPLGVYIAVGAAVLVIVIVLVLAAVKGKGKARKTARKVLKGAVKGNSGGTKKKSSSKGKKK